MEASCKLRIEPQPTVQIGVIGAVQAEHNGADADSELIRELLAREYCPGEAEDGMWRGELRIGWRRIEDKMRQEETESSCRRGALALTQPLGKASRVCAGWRKKVRYLYSVPAPTPAAALATFWNRGRQRLEA